MGSAQCIGPGPESSTRLQLLYRQISMPFEWQCARGFAARHNAVCLPVDSGEISRRELPFWDRQLLDYKNIEALLSSSPEKEGLKEIFEAQYQRARMMLSSPPRPASCHTFTRPCWVDRERAMARRILRAHDRYGDVVHIGGWLHMVRTETGVSVASLLDSYSPAIYLVTAYGALCVSRQVGVQAGHSRTVSGQH